MEDMINISDNIGPHGYVVIKNHDTGEILFKGHNMVVANGRRAVFFLFLNQFFSNINDFNDENANDNGVLNRTNFNSLLSNLKMVCKLSNDGGQTQYSDNALKSKSNCKEITNLGSLCAATCDNNSKTLYLKISFSNIKNDSGDISSISELGLFMKSESDSTEYMFSRITFDPIPYSANESFDMTYYIYF